MLQIRSKTRRQRKASSVIWVSLLVLLLAQGCAQASPTVPTGSETRSQDIVTASPRILRMGMISSSEPTQGVAFGSSAGGGEHPFMLHAALTIYDAQGTLQPQLATKVPTIEDGDWQVLPDGRMEVTW